MKALFGVLLVLAVVGAACTTPAPEPAAAAPADDEPETQEEAVETPKANAAPDFTVDIVSGGEYSFSASDAERPVVVYFMASWCPTCAKNWAALNEVYPKYEDQVDFIAISIDPTDSAAVLEKLAAEKGFVFDTSPGNVDVALDFGVTKQTAKFAIDADGNIVERHDGALTAAEWDAFFGQLI